MIIIIIVPAGLGLLAFQKYRRRIRIIAVIYVLIAFSSYVVLRVDE